VSAEIVTVNTKAIEQLGADIERGKRAFLGRLAERGGQLLRAEVPYETGNLRQGVAPPNVDYANMEATLTVSARSGQRASMIAEVFGADGKKLRTVTLRGNPSFNYAAAVARGRAAIAPRNAHALLIPVPFAPQGQGYLLAGGQVYIAAKSI
jgi:hypothetical protein